jgi:purine-binding chemotaxis protein CheW
VSEALHVVFKLGGSDYALSAGDVLHMESFEGATPVPGAPAHVAGLVQIRRRVVPVVDLRRRFGLPEQPATLQSRVVVVQHRERTVGLLVDSAREVVQIHPDQLRPPPEVIAQQAEGYVRQVAQVGDRLLMLIDVDKVIGEDTGDGR